MGIFSKAMQDKSINISMPDSKVVHGVEVRKLPMGKQVKSLKALESLPENIMEEVFPGQSVGEVLLTFTRAKKDDIVPMFIRLLTTLPTHIVEVMCSIADIDRDTAMDNLSLMEFVDVCVAWWELNDVSRFFTTVRGLLGKLMPALPNIGSSDGSQSEKPSESGSDPS